MTIRQVAILRRTLLLVAFSSLLFAQSERGTISGTVSDSSGAVIPGAKVTVTNLSTNTSITTATSGAGDYTAPQLPPGQYNVRIDKEGFKPAVTANVTVNTSTNTRVDITLEVGTAQQAIEVQASAVTLQTEAILLARHAELGGELIRISIERPGPVGNFTAWRPAIPVLHWRTVKP